MPLPDRVRLIVLFGGRSAEHEVSCTTASAVLEAVDADRYDTLPVGITREGRWVRNDEAVAALAAGRSALPRALEVVGSSVEPLPTVTAPTDPGVPTVVLPLLHGPHGEDGTVQGLLELAGVPYVGAGVLGSAVAMDKDVAKRLAAEAGLPQPHWRAFRDTEITDGLPDHLIAELGLPCFVKPANLGSSVGVSKVRDRDELAAAVELAVEYDEYVVVEEGVDGEEIEVAVLGNAEPRASVPGRVIPANEFYDYADKYVDGATEYVIPAELDPAQTEQVRSLAVRAFRSVRAEGMARCDFFHEPDGRGFLLNEINTIPGFTPFSMYPKLWDASGMGYPELIDELVRLALERHERRSRLRTDL